MFRICIHYRYGANPDQDRPGLHSNKSCPTNGDSGLFRIRTTDWIAFALNYHRINKTSFKNVFILDFAPEAIVNFKKIAPDFPSENIIEKDFFDHTDSYDIIIEQTFFCAIHPSKRKDYAEHSSRLLKDNGKLIGVLFNRDFNGGPPFGGDLTEYETLFSGLYREIIIDVCYNSIKPRIGTELFIRLVK